MDNDSFGESAGQSHPPRDAAAPDFGQSASPALARTSRLVSGDFLLTVNPIDGSEIEACPPGEQPPPPARHSAAERTELQRAAQPPVPAGPASRRLPLLERDEERRRLVRLLGRGRSVRLTGPAGSGRSALLDAVAEECADLAPDGVVRLSGYHRTPTELLYELFAAVHSAPLHRPSRARLLELVRDIGAIVVLDDLEFGGAALTELLDAAPECAFLVAATPDIAAPSADSHLEEVFLAGLGRGASLDLLKRAVDRPLTEDEANWAGDLWFESEGLPLRFVQAGALLRQSDSLRADPEDADPHDASPFDAADVPLPTLGEGAAPAALLASRLSESARETLRLAVALGGEVPHQAHLPALVGDTHADAALGELMSCGLLSPVGTRYRLAAGVVAQLTEKGYAEDVDAHAHTAARHYTWWVGHPSVIPQRAVAEADAILAALTALVPGKGAGHPSAAVLLARSAAPALAAGLHWSAWERTLRVGSAAARLAGEVAEEAYFHHELGVLALCNGSLDRARAELEASIAMRGALADKRGTVAGRRALALVADRAGGPLLGGRTPAGEEVPAARYEESASPPRGIPAAAPLAALESAGRSEEAATLVSRHEPTGGGAAKQTRRGALLGGARRNLVAAGAGALLAAVLGTAVTLGATSDKEDPPGGKVRNGQSANEDDAENGLDADEPAADSSDRPSGAPSDDPKDPASVTPGAGHSSGTRPTPGGRPSSSASTPGEKPSTSSKPPTKPTSKPPTTSRPPSTPPPPSETPAETPPPTSTPPSTDPPSSASGPAESSSASMTSSSAPSSADLSSPVI